MTCLHCLQFVCIILFSINFTFRAKLSTLADPVIPAGTQGGSQQFGQSPPSSLDSPHPAVWTVPTQQFGQSPPSSLDSPHTVPTQQFGQSSHSPHPAVWTVLTVPTQQFGQSDPPSSLDKSVHEPATDTPSACRAREITLPRTAQSLRPVCRP